jgi:hypothetical protein
LTDGSVRVISRNESAEDAPDNLRHLTAISHNGGETWSEPERLEELITPRCHGSVARLDEKTLAFSAPASPFRQNVHPYGRYNLTLRLSHDDGASWSTGRTLWPHPGSYSDLAVLTDGSIACVYEPGEKGSTHYWDELHFARSDKLYLIYTRKGADNDHVFRNRAPIFIAQVDPDKLHLLRATERILMPETGLDLGGGYAPVDVNENETWVISTEMGFPEDRKDENNRILLAKILWNRSH